MKFGRAVNLCQREMGHGRWLETVFLACALAMAVCLSATICSAQDDEDWHVVPHSSGGGGSVSGDAAAGSNSVTKETAGAAEIVVACGERARPAGEPFKSIMAQIMAVRDAPADIQLFESVAPTGPHSRPPGCAFYNLPQMTKFLNSWMNMQDSKALEPMFYAVLAHELGHLMHHDFDPGRRALGSVRLELEADQFAGYTLSRLNIRAENISDYYRLTGDDFAGAANSHGNSGQRAAAFMAGWRRAEMGLTEQSTIGVGGSDHP